LKILSAQQLAEADQATMDRQNLSSIDLMERVATLLFERIHQRLNGAPVPIKIFCGIGKNGGDGLALGRHLIQHGYHVRIYIANCSKKRAPEFLKNYDRIKEVTKDWPILLSCKGDFPEITEKDFIIDAIFGTGINRPVTGWMIELFKYLNSINCFTAAVDMPSGLFASEPSKNLDAILRADHTFTFQTPKLSFFMPECGEVIGTYEVLNIGLDPHYMMEVQPIAQMITREAAQSMYRKRNVFSHKGDYGHVLCMGGSYGKMGAITLTTGAAVNSGAGKVTAYIPQRGNTIVQQNVPEAMTMTDAGQTHLTDFQPELDSYTLCIGPGMGQGDDQVSAFAKAVKSQSTPIVIDADGINILASHPELIMDIPANSVLTPHDGELKGLIRGWSDSADKLEKAKEFSKEHDLILVVKGAYTMTVAGDSVYVNDSGNPGMATGGSGDVLTGIIASFIAQGYDVLTATVFAVYLHGASADLASQTYGHEGLKASIISNFVGPAILQLFRQPQNN
jgi:NAD(P)H-hydrate epimerase